MSTALLDKRETRIRRMFNHIAPSYDLLNHLLSLNIDRSWRRRTMVNVSRRRGWTSLGMPIRTDGRTIDGRRGPIRTATGS